MVRPTLGQFLKMFLEMVSKRYDRQMFHSLAIYMTMQCEKTKTQKKSTYGNLEYENKISNAPHLKVN